MRACVLACGCGCLLERAFKGRECRDEELLEERDGVAHRLVVPRHLVRVRVRAWDRARVRGGGRARVGLGLGVEARLVAPRHQREAGTRLGVRRVLAVEQRLHQRAERVPQPEQRQLFQLLAEQRAGGLELLGLG